MVRLCYAMSVGTALAKQSAAAFHEAYMRSLTNPMAERTWQTSPAVPPAEIDKLITDLRAASEDASEHRLRNDLIFELSELIALDRAALVLTLDHRNPAIAPEVRERRKPFVDIAIKIVQSRIGEMISQAEVTLGKLRRLYEKDKTNASE